MGLVGLHGRRRIREAWFEVIDVAAVEALGVGALAGVPFDGYSYLLIGREVPHDVDNVAVVLRAELDAELAEHLAAARAGNLRGWAEIGKLDGGGLLGSELEGGAHFFGGDGQTVTLRGLNLSVGDVEIAGADLGFGGGGKSKRNQAESEKKVPAPALYGYHFLTLWIGGGRQIPYLIGGRYDRRNPRV